MSPFRQNLPMPLRRVYRRVRAEILSIGLPAVQVSQPDQEAEASKDISVIVPVKDAFAVTRRCLLSLEKFAPKAEIIIVDDGSERPETLELLAEFSTRNQWVLNRQTKTRGHSKSCEAGVRLATRRYLCLLNSDTVVTPWSWWAAKDAFETDPLIGVNGPSTSYSATEQMIPRAMHCRHYWSDAQINAFANKYVRKLKPRAWLDISEAGGFACFIRRSLWQDLGGFDSNLPDYGNESEFCRRVLRRGMRVVWTRNSYIHHFGHQSYGRIGNEFIWQRSRAARDYILQKHS